MQVVGQVVLVTGGARGIGLDAARRLRARGATVVLVDVDEVAAKREADGLGERALGFGADVTERAQLDSVVDEVIAAVGRIDVVIANAGIAPPVATVWTGSEAAFDRVLDVNLRGVVNTVRATLPALIETRGYLLIVSSLYTVVNGALCAPYAMSKAAVEAFGRALRVELAGHSVGVGIAYFGFVDTGLMRDAIDRPGIAELRRSIPHFVTKVVPVGRAGAAISEGVASRATRVAAPRWVRFTLPLRGLLQYADGVMVGQSNVRDAIAAAEASQPTDRVPRSRNGRHR